MDFLQSRSHAAIRRELRSIQESYHHYWDLLAELVQNARDAIHRAHSQGKQGPFFIHISIDATSRSVEVLDNGIGISEAKLPELLAPGGSDKQSSTAEVGEKGVGLTYALFCGDEFAIQSKTETQPMHSGSVTGARAWLMAKDDGELPVLKRSPAAFSEQPTVPAQLTGSPSLSSLTRIRIGKLPPPTDDQDIFALTSAQLKFLLRTRTAIGTSDPLFERESSVPFLCSYNFTLGGQDFQGTIETKYPVPHLFIASKDAVRLKDVQTAFVTRKTNEQRTKYLRGKTVWESREVSSGNAVVRVYGVMFPGNSVFSDLSGSSLSLGAHGQDDSSDYLFRSGVYLATKRMPTGVVMDAPPGGRYPAYYKRCLFVVESDDIKFDLGRKSMHWQFQRRLQAGVATVFKQLEEIAVYQSDEKVAPGFSTSTTGTKAERDAEAKALWSRLRGLVDLKSSKIPFAKVPDGQEAAVAAIFHELLGAGSLRGYRTLSTGYSSRYDVHVLYAMPSTGAELELVLEFKHSLESLIRDFEDGRKSLSDIHILVAWDANEQKLKDAGFQLDAVTSGAYDGVNYELTLPVAGTDAIPVILLKDLIKALG